MLRQEGDKVLQIADDGGWKRRQEVCWQGAASIKVKIEEVWGLWVQIPINWNNLGRMDTLLLSILPSLY